MKRLVVNADDLGVDLGRNRGIAEAASTGAVTAVSVLANGAALSDAVEQLARPENEGISVGVHLNLSEGFPVVTGHRQLVGPDGRLFGKWTAHERLRAAPGKALREEIVREVEAQIGRLCSLGLTPDHLDGHQHVHLLPAVLDAAVAACLRHDIRWFRLPEERAPRGTRDDSSSPHIFSRWAREARHTVMGAGLRSPRFLGLHTVGNLDTPRLRAFVSSVPEGVTELMVHPGRVLPEGREPRRPGFSNRDRERELAALLNPDFAAALEEFGVMLTGFPSRSR